MLQPTAPDLIVGKDDLRAAPVLALLQLHLDEMHSFSPPTSVHAMTAERLRAPDVTFWAAWSGDDLAGVAALKQLDARHGEIKSMRAAPQWRGRGVGQVLLDHVIAQARARGYKRLSLETGRTAPFQPAQKLYAANGFAECSTFAHYVLDGFSICMSRAL
jgi:putative acetyltransferase